MNLSTLAHEIQRKNHLIKEVNKTIEQTQKIVSENVSILKFIKDHHERTLK